MDKPKYYKSINELPLSRFIDCLVDKNIFALVISGEPGKDVLEVAWKEIKMDFNNHMIDEEGKMHLRLVKEVEDLKLEIDKVNAAFALMKAKVNYPELVPFEIDKYANYLNKLTDSSFAFDYNDPEQFNIDLVRTNKRARSIVVMLGIKETALNAITTKEDNKIIEHSREYFQSVLNNISFFTKFQLTDAITTYSFCDWVKKFNAHCKFLESQNKK